MFRIDLMTPDDVAAVSAVERRCFTNPWPVSAYRRELQNPAQNYYIVLWDVPEPAEHEEKPEANGPAAARTLPRRTLFPIGLGRRADADDEARVARIVGFAGMWSAFDEAHVTTIAIDEPYRGRGLGEWLLATLFDEAVRRGANWLTLEVRVSNESAQALYRKWGFSGQGTRRRYYSDNNEDALIMWSRALNDAGYGRERRRLRQALFDRLDGQIADGDAVASRRNPSAVARR
ncbi:MAG TPA: ribosomal protein S18-alanine N-acetyltransferase [Thermomicrobiales bacterium]|nr:ribosomal protein S18-alanine N-acetyltransferase [Thermomicrobiales bacterium]